MSRCYSSTMIMVLLLSVFGSACSAKQQIANQQTDLPAIDFNRGVAKHSSISTHANAELRFDPNDPISPEQWQKLQTASPEQIRGAMAKAGNNWLYGPGLGRTTTNVSTVVLFPPYALYLLGNAGLSLAGFQQLYITYLLPQAPRKHVLDFYDGITSVPGRVSALVAGKQYYQPTVRSR